jgi:serine/threonine protein kinase
MDLAFKEVILGDSMHHENLARILDIYVGDVPRLVFHWTDASRLLQTAIDDQGCSGQALSQIQKVRITGGMLSGLAHLHGRGIVHSNLHPSAIVVHCSPVKDVPCCGEPTSQILDLAGAAILGTVTEGPSGPMEYMAPEVLAGCSHPSTLADVWSAAVVVAFVFTGRSLFGQSPADHGQALTNIFEVFGGLSTLDIDEFRKLPNFLPEHEVPAIRPSVGIADLAASPGAELLLHRMLIFGWTRFFGLKYLH